MAVARRFQSSRRGTSEGLHGEPSGATTAAQCETPIDLAHLRRYTLGNAALEREILGLFAGQAPHTIESLRTAETERDWRAAAHTLKGSARAVGAKQLAILAEALEQMDGWRNPAVRQPAMTALEATFAETCAFIDKR